MTENQLMMLLVIGGGVVVVGGAAGAIWYLNRDTTPKKGGTGETGSTEEETDQNPGPTLGGMLGAYWRRSNEEFMNEASKIPGNMVRSVGGIPADIYDAGTDNVAEMYNLAKDDAAKLAREAYKQGKRGIQVLPPVAIPVYLHKNRDTIKSKAADVWDTITFWS